MVTMGLVTVAMGSRLTMVTRGGLVTVARDSRQMARDSTALKVYGATGIWMRAMAWARVKMVRAGNNQMVTAARAKARAIMCGMGLGLAMVARDGLTTVEPRAQPTAKLHCGMPLKRPLQ